MHLFPFPGWLGNEASRSQIVIRWSLANPYKWPFSLPILHSESCLLPANYVQMNQELTRVSLRCRCCSLISTGFTKDFIHVRIHISATCACMKGKRSVEKTGRKDEGGERWEGERDTVMIGQ